MKSKTVLQVTDLTKTFPSKSREQGNESVFKVLDMVSFVLGKGEVLGILGPNGAGKTTLIQILLSVLKPTSGIIEYFGLDFFKHRTKALEYISFASSYTKLPAQLTVRDNLDIYAQLYGISRKERAYNIEKYLKFFGMWNLADEKTGVLSAGQMTRIMLAKAFISNPRIILLDEPTASLDPDIAHEVRSFILEQQKEQELSILVTSHNMEEVVQLCNRALVLKKGEIIENDTPQNLALSITHSRLSILPDDKNKLIQMIQKNRIRYTQEDDLIALDIEERDVASFLTHLAEHAITYSQISMEKPKLEDYFLTIARKK